MAAPTFPINVYRLDPYKNFKFRVRWDGKVVAGISKVSALKQSTEPVEHRSGGDPSTTHKSPSTWKIEPVTLERGLTHDLEFEKWASLIWSTDGDAAVSLRHFRKDIIIELLNLQGRVVKSYKLFRCWVSEFQTLPELDANGNAIAIEMMVIQTEGFQRDPEIVEEEET